MESLTYDQARNIIQDGDVVFFQGIYSWKHPIDSLIMFVTGSPFVHCNIAFWVEVGGQKRLMAVEAQGATKRRIVNESFYNDKNMVVIAAPVAWDTIANAALEKVAVTKYGYLAAIYAGIRDLSVRTLGVRLPNTNPPGEICSEFVAKLVGLEDADISPGDLYFLLLKVSKVRTL